MKCADNASDEKWPKKIIIINAVWIQQKACCSTKIKKT
jgi:hypothetical protein